MNNTHFKWDVTVYADFGHASIFAKSFMLAACTWLVGAFPIGQGMSSMVSAWPPYQMAAFVFVSVYIIGFLFCMVRDTAAVSHTHIRCVWSMPWNKEAFCFLLAIPGGREALTKKQLRLLANVHIQADEARGIRYDSVLGSVFGRSLEVRYN